MLSAYCTVNGASLHYLDWGGTGHTLLLLPGFGSTAHIYIDFAPHFASQFRVLALTRRGHGQSDKPATGYDSATLLDDIDGFLAAQGVQRVTLIGHSFAGNELKGFAARHADQVEHLVYLDAAYDFASLGEIAAETPRVLSPSREDRASFEIYKGWLQRSVFGFWSEALEADLRHRTVLGPDGTLEFAMPAAASKELLKATWKETYADVSAPSLAFYAWQEEYYLRLFADADPAALDEVRRYFGALHTPWQRRSMEQFRHESGGRIVELPATQHFCFIQRQADVVREVKRFLQA